MICRNPHLLVLAVFMASLGWAQSSQPETAQAELGTVYGGGVQAPLRYATQSPLRNAFLFSIGEETWYDDNIFSNNANRHSDVVFSVVPRLAYLRQGQRVKWGLEFQPGFLLYREHPTYNSLNQGLAFDGQAQISPHVVVRLSPDFSRKN